MEKVGIVEQPPVEAVYEPLWPSMADRVLDFRAIRHLWLRENCTVQLYFELLLVIKYFQL